MRNEVLKLLDNTNNGYGDGAGDSPCGGEPDSTGLGSGDADSHGEPNFTGYGYGDLKTTSGVSFCGALGEEEQEENLYNTQGCHKWS